MDLVLIILQSRKRIIIISLDYFFVIESTVALLHELKELTKRISYLVPVHNVFKYVL